MDSVCVFVHQTSKPTMRIYTDGACLKNNQKDNTVRKAAWAFVCVDKDDNVLKTKRGMVITDQDHKDYIGAYIKTNNAAELSAIYWAIKLHCVNPYGSFSIFSDSIYAINSIKGVFNGVKNKELIESFSIFTFTSTKKTTWTTGRDGGWYRIPNSFYIPTPNDSVTQ